MSDPYKVLGLDRTATTDQVKQAYRRLAMKFHPDRNDGNDTKFKEVQSAYEKVKDGPPEPTFGAAGRTTSDFGFNFNFEENFSDILRQARQQMSVSVNAPITLNKAVAGGAFPMRLQVHGTTHEVIVKIPPGVVTGETIKYPKLVKGIDVVIKFVVQPNPGWSVSELNLVKQEDISIWELIVGGSLNVTTIDGSVLRLKIPPKTQPGTKLRVTGRGIASRTNPAHIGDMLVDLNAIIPKDIPEELLVMIRGLSS